MLPVSAAVVAGVVRGTVGFVAIVLFLLIVADIAASRQLFPIAWLTVGLVLCVGVVVAVQLWARTASEEHA